MVRYEGKYQDIGGHSTRLNYRCFVDENFECKFCTSSLYVCMAIKYIIVLFVETPRKCITAKLSIRKPGSSSVLIIDIIISTDEDPGLRIESFAVINLRRVSTNKTIINSVYLFRPKGRTIRKVMGGGVPMVAKNATMGTRGGKNIGSQDHWSQKIFEFPQMHF
jgi:hypothetical protein